MFKKRKKQTAEATVVATSHPLFDFSVIDSGMRDASRDYSSLSAYAAVQKSANALQVVPVPVPVVVPEVKPVVAQKKKPIVSRMVLLSGFFILLASMIGGGALLWSLRSQEPPVTAPIARPPVVTSPVVVPPPVDVPTRFDTQGKDTDSDGLTDAEERLFGTDIRNPDTDEDTFLDNNEVFHGYDPTKPSPASLADSQYANEYTYSGKPSFHFLKLNPWSIEAPTIIPEGSRGSLRLLTASGAEFRISILELGTGQTMGDWYDASTWRDTYGVYTQLHAFVSKQGYVGRMTEDKRTAFLDNGDSVIVFEYDLKMERVVEYAQVFQMMINSFLILP